METATTRPPRSCRRAALACLPLLFAGGCALTPELGPPPAIGPPPPLMTEAQVDSLQNTRAAADSAAAALNRLIRLRYPDGVIPTRTLESVTRTGRSAPPESLPATSPGAGAAASADSSASSDSARVELNGPPAITVDLPPRELSRLAGAARTYLAWADSMAQDAALRPLPERERDKLETALGLVRQGREALQRGDVRAAANLGYKARLLVEEVVPK
jgi:hypothetical protein